jgi:hypothetical protein
MVMTQFARSIPARQRMVLLALSGCALSSPAAPLWADSNYPVTPVPGYVAPVTVTPVAPYVDDTRGVYVPGHDQFRRKTGLELASWNQSMQGDVPAYEQTGTRAYESALNTVADGVADTSRELDRISRDPGVLSRTDGSASADTVDGTQVALNFQASPSADDSLSKYPSLATGGSARPRAVAPAPAVDMPNTRVSDFSSQPVATTAARSSDGGMELAATQSGSRGDLDLQHSVVRLKEERISVRRALQRMLDQVGGGSWTVVWDLDEVNAGLPDMEISIYAEEPFIKVMNALLARLQTRSGQPIRVIKYDKTQRLVITDRTGGNATSASTSGKTDGDMAVTETVLKEASVSLHYDEVPLVDALENIVNQAGKGQWRLRMYAGTDQVLKPAHIEEPFGVALERILKVFNLRYEVFPGGKLIVVTSGSSFGFRGVE